VSHLHLLGGDDVRAAQVVSVDITNVVNMFKVLQVLSKYEPTNS